MPLAYLPMRAFAFSVIALLSVVDLAWSQVSITPSGQATEIPMYRPQRGVERDVSQHAWFGFSQTGATEEARTRV